MSFVSVNKNNQASQGSAPAMHNAAAAIAAPAAHNAAGYQPAAAKPAGGAVMPASGSFVPYQKQASAASTLTHNEADSCQMARYGCRDPDALNYDSSATHSHASVPCIPVAKGCTDKNATNHHSTAGFNSATQKKDGHYYTDYVTMDDGSCVNCVYGCMHPASLTYNEAATCADELNHPCMDKNGDCVQPGALNHMAKQQPQAPAADACK